MALKAIVSVVRATKKKIKKNSNNNNSGTGKSWEGSEDGRKHFIRPRYPVAECTPGRVFSHRLYALEVVFPLSRVV